MYALNFKCNLYLMYWVRKRKLLSVLVKPQKLYFGKYMFLSWSE
jgi:hypothetical protein